MLEVEQALNREFAVLRDDVLEFGIFDLAELRAGQCVRPESAMRMLGMSGQELLGLVRSGVLPAPAKWGGGRVAWRADEIATAAERFGRPK